jgi:hypothetical protein
MVNQACLSYEVHFFEGKIVDNTFVSQRLSTLSLYSRLKSSTQSFSDGNIRP